LAKMIHAMIRVLDLDRSLNFYRDVFGLHVSQKLDFPDFIASHGVHNDAKLAEHVHPD
jgi:lactoylglutathione lyase